MATALTACGTPKKKKSSAPAPTQKIFVHGDPREVIKGATFDRESFLTVSDAAAFDGFESTTFMFLQQSEAATTPTTQESLEEENAATTAEEAPAPPTFRMRDLGGGTWQYAPAGGDPKGEYVRLGFESVGDKLVLKSAWDLPVEVLHYSVRPDREVMSFLLQLHDYPEYGDVIIAAYFHKPGDAAAALTDVDSTYNYLLGEGVATAWQDKIEVSLCGAFDPREESAARKAIAGWAKSGKVGSHELTLTANKTPAPFSDVNENCVLMVDAFSLESRYDAAVLGAAFPVVDGAAQRIIASDVLLFRKGFEKIYGSSLTEADIEATAAHELGHFLGLDHEFDPSVESIMSYDQVLEIKPHDRAAIEAVYGSYPEEGTFGLL
jgi:hypothetical protein